MKKKKKSKTKRPAHAGDEELDKAEVHDELLALEAIFGEEIQLDNSNGFILRVVPHPGEAETNYVSIQLEIRCAVVPSILLQVSKFPPPRHRSPTALYVSKQVPSPLPPRRTPTPSLRTTRP